MLQTLFLFSMIRLCGCHASASLVDSQFCGAAETMLPYAFEIRIISFDILVCII